MARKTGKRKAVVAAYLYEPKLQRVARALENLRRVGAPVATGSSERYPPPGLAFKSDAEGELHFPVGKHDAEKIKTRAMASQQSQWDVSGDLVEMCNPRWHAFVTECFEAKRESLGISAAATIELSLNKMLLLEAGARLQVRQDDKEKRRDGVFGSLVVTLPGAFKGGGLVFQSPSPDPTQQGESQAKEKAPTWRPATRKTAYDLTYAAFYDHCACEIKPITSGSVVYLVYDLATKTPDEVPLYGGPKLLQHAVHTALTEYFDVTPQPLAKRLKISADAWSTINEFISERRFVHIVEGNSWTNLSEDDRQVAESLAAFCAQSKGQFVLYHAGVLCSRESEYYKGYGHNSSLDESDGDLKLTLKTPWVKYGDSVVRTFPPVQVLQKRDVTPLGRAEDIKLYVQVYDMDMDDYDIIEKIHYNFRKTGVGNTFALVVQPSSIEQTQLAQMPIEDVTITLRALLPDSREEALRYARRVLRYRSPWKVECHISHTRASRHSSSWTEESNSEEMLRNFVAVVIDINDLQLFKDLLLNIILTRIDAIGSLRPAVDHFGWDACLDTIVKRILSTPTLRGRCNLIGAIIDASSDSSRTNALLDPLFSLHPWTDVIVDASLKTCCESYDPDKSSFSRLLKCVNASSPDKLQQMVSVTCPEALMKVVVPALESLKNHMDRVLLQSLVDHVSKLLDKVHAVVLNDVFAKVRLPAHCSNCEAVQAFLLSPATEATIPFTGSTQQIKHIQSVLKSHVKYPSTVSVRASGGNAARVTKNRGDSVYDPMERAKETLNKITRPKDERRSRESLYSWEW